MKAKIGVELLRGKQTKAGEKKFEIWDTELKGFGLIVYPDIVKPDGRVEPGGKIYVARYRLANGKQTMARIGRHTLFTPAQARDEAEKILRMVKDGVDPAAEKKTAKQHTFKSFLDDVYAPWAEANQKDGKATVNRLRNCFAEFLSTDLINLTAWNVEKWRTRRLKEGLKPSTVNRDLTALKALVSKAVEWKALQDHPLSKVKPSKVDDGSRVRFLSKDEEQNLMRVLDERETRARAERSNANQWRRDRGYPLFPDLAAASFADHLKPMVLVSLNTGLRWGELVSLTWEKVDLDRALITVGGQTAKSGKTRYIPLNSPALDALAGWKKQSAGTLVFPGRKGGVLDNVNKAWGAVLEAAGIADFHWHDMRHHFASKLVMAGVDLNTVRELLGHSDLKMTLRYAHLAPEHKAAAVAKLVR
ncbi:site-specific integrase [Geomonas agri]|uniref:site-specific integrase n=1 Tax=Geomonas agri TaxID=2873702 RepID=UPI001CD49B4B|nr:site-specific integrase [Geomonas agri]